MTHPLLNMNFFGCNAIQGNHKPPTSSLALWGIKLSEVRLKCIWQIFFYLLDWIFMLFSYGNRKNKLPIAITVTPTVASQFCERCIVIIGGITPSFLQNTVFTCFWACDTPFRATSVFASGYTSTVYGCWQPNVSWHFVSFISFRLPDCDVRYTD